MFLPVRPIFTAAYHRAAATDGKFAVCCSRVFVDSLRQVTELRLLTVNLQWAAAAFS